MAKKAAKTTDSPTLAAEVAEAVSQAAQTTSEPDLTVLTLPIDKLNFEQTIEALALSKDLVEQADQVAKFERERMLKLFARYTALRNDDLMEIMGMTPAPPKAMDKRKVFNPLKNLKISAKRAYDWAVDFNQTADAARERAILAVNESATDRYADHPEIAPYLSKGELPPVIVEYIDHWYTHYDEIKAAKGVGEEDPAAEESDEDSDVPGAVLQAGSEAVSSKSA